MQNASMRFHYFFLSPRILVCWGAYISILQILVSFNIIAAICQSFSKFESGLQQHSNSQRFTGCFIFRYIDMAETLCQKRALEAFRLDPAKWGGNCSVNSIEFLKYLKFYFALRSCFCFFKQIINQLLIFIKNFKRLECQSGWFMSTSLGSYGVLHNILKDSSSGVSSVMALWSCKHPRKLEMFGILNIHLARKIKASMITAIVEPNTIDAYIFWCS